MTRPLILLACLACTLSARAAIPVIHDAETRAWWRITTELSADTMEGRDTGSAGHARAVAYVAARLRAAGLKPAGDRGSYTQTLPLTETRVEKDGTRFERVPDAGPAVSLAFLHDISVRATAGLPDRLEAPVVFRGYCGKADLGPDVRGKVVLCFGARRSGLPSGSERLSAAAEAGAAGLIVVDDPGFSVEPPRWPEAYARDVNTRGAPPPVAPALAAMRLNAAAFAGMISGSGQSAEALLAGGSASRPLASFSIPARLRATFRLTHRNYTSDNVLGLLPGTDPRLAAQVVVVSAHLDGYGYGEPVDGDRLYNGAFDDAACVATLIRLAESRHGRGFRRGVLFAAFTGEEKGLLGANWFVAHPTLPRNALAADINLDQLRPLFPLKILTMHAIADTTLADAVRRVAAPMGIEVRPDREPERNLLRRADHWPFLAAGIPATGFVFGYDPGTEAERRYRLWYAKRYHRPQDDTGQPFDPRAAADLNTFFYRLTAEVADGADRPAFLPDSPLRLRN